ncbi:MAG: mechanosensitive ion channel [Ruminococcus sp.]|nr:mechanosensitive ion channel [Ruminococcus sp.]
MTETVTATTASEETEKNSDVIEKALSHLSDALPTLLMALAILVVGVLIAKIIARFISKALKKSNIDGAARSFLVSLIRILLYLVVLIMALTVLNVPMSSIITIFGAAGLAVSLAMQSCLSNLAGGFIILFSRPFIAGDTIEIDGSVGKVKEITILYTKIETFDCKIVFIPNGKVSDAKIINFTQTPTRRIDMKFDISYDSDYTRARALLLELIENERTILKNPEPVVRMSAHNDSTISIDVLVWVNNDDYSDTRYKIIESVKECFDRNGIDIPFNQLDVHIKERN